MSDATLSIRLSPPAEAIVNSLTTLPARMLRGIASALREENENAIAITTTVYTGFPKDGPPVPGGLRHQSGLYNRSLRQQEPVISGNSVISAIGTNVPYARLHEFGGEITRTSKPGTARLRTNARGELIRGSTGGAVFAKATHKRAREVKFAGGKTFTAEYPERAPVRKGIRDNLPNYRAAISNAIVAAWNQK